MSYVNHAITTLILGFGFSVLIASILMLLKSKRIQSVVAQYIQTAIAIIRTIGLLFMVMIVVSLLTGGITQRATGPYAWAYWMMLIGPIVCTQLLWFRYVRESKLLVVLISLGLIFSNGAFMEEFTIAVTSIHRDGSFTTAMVLGALATNLIRLFSFAGLVWLLQSFVTRRQINDKKQTQIKSHD